MANGANRTIGLAQTGPPPNANYVASGRKFKGHGFPEGVVAGYVGDEYLDLDTFDTWTKISGDERRETVSGWSVEADVSTSALITSTGSTTPRLIADRLSIVRDVRDFGGLAEDDPESADIRATLTTDEIVSRNLTALRAAAAALRDGETLLIPNGTLIRLPSAVSTAQIGCLIDNLSDISIVGAIDNDEFGLSDTDVWKGISSMTAVGTTVTVTTTAAHGRGIGEVIEIYADCDPAYNGAVIIASTPTPTTFTYETLGAPFTGSTPLVTPATGVMKYARPDFDRYLFRFTRCQNVTCDLSFEGQAVPFASSHRLGYQLLDFRQSGGVDNTIKDIKLFIRGGCSNGLSAGFYQSTTIGHASGGKVQIDAKDCGYPVSGWSRAFGGTNFDLTGERVHRLGYLAGKQGGTIIGRVKDFSSSGILLTSHFDGTTHYGVEDIYCRVTDTGTTLGIPWMQDPAQSVRFLVGIAGSLGAGTPHYRNITLECDLKVTDVIGRNIQAVRVFHSATEDCIFSDITIKGSIDRSEVTDLSLFADDSNGECFIHSYPNQETRNIFFESFRVENSAAILAGTSGEKARFKRNVVCENNVGRVYFLDSETTSPVSKLISGGTEKDFDSTVVLFSNGSQSSPSITFAGDPNTGFYRIISDDGTIRFSSNGALVLSIFGTAIAPQTTAVFDFGSPSQEFRNFHGRSIIRTPTVIATGVNVNIDFGASVGDLRTLDVASNITFAAVNIQAGRYRILKMICDSTPRTFTWPAWKWMGTAPTGLAANKTALLRLTTWGTTVADVVAEWIVEA